MTPLDYLGEGELVCIHAEYDRRRAKSGKDHYHAFGWSFIDLPDSHGAMHPQGCMIAWVPANTGVEMGIFPCYIGAGNVPDLGGRTAWEWTNESREKPTLHPSLLMEYEHDGKTYRIAHGFIRNGVWEGVVHAI